MVCSALLSFARESWRREISRARLSKWFAQPCWWILALRDQPSKAEQMACSALLVDLGAERSAEQG